MCKSNSEFFQILKSLRPTYNDNASVEKMDSFTPVMEAILESLPKIPYDSAVLVLTGNKPRDQEMGPLVEEALIRRRCRVRIISHKLKGESDASSPCEFSRIFPPRHLPAATFIYFRLNFFRCTLFGREKKNPTILY